MADIEVVTLQSRRLQRVRNLKTRRHPDHSLTFLGAQFQRTVARPYRQFRQVCEAWEREIPADLLPRTRLEGMTRGVLRIGVSSSAHLYTLDRLLRGGLERRILDACGGSSPPRRIRLQVVAFED